MNEDDFIIFGNEEDEIAELLADLEVFRACASSGHFPAPLNGFYGIPNDDGTFSVTLYDYSRGTDFATVEEAKERILRLSGSYVHSLRNMGCHYTVPGLSVSIRTSATCLPS